MNKVDEHASILPVVSLSRRRAHGDNDDGYTPFLADGSVFVALPELHHDVPFDVNDFMPIGFIAEQPHAILASKRLAVKSFFLSDSE